jgi:hypothetical protein
MGFYKILKCGYRTVYISHWCQQLLSEMFFDIVNTDLDTMLNKFWLCDICNVIKFVTMRS